MAPSARSRQEASARQSADFNLDGCPDVAGPSSVGLHLGNGDGTFEPFGIVGLGLSIAVGDLNNDGKPDAVTAWMGEPEYGQSAMLFIHSGNGDGTFAPRQTVYLPNNWGEPWSLAVADLDGDGLLDVVAASETSGGNDYTVSVYRGDGSTVNLPGYGSRFAGFTNTLAIADVNGDNRPDIISTIQTTDEVLVNLGMADGNFAGPVSYAAGDAPQCPEVADINGDSLPDLVIANPGWWDGTDYVGEGVSILFGYGNGTFTAPVLYPTSGSAQDVAAGDFNGDGHTDLAVADGPATTVLINDGVWIPPSPLPPPPPSITIGDVAITEGNTGTVNATFTVNLSNVSDEDVIVLYATANGTATAGSDYQAASGTLTFASGQISQKFTVTVKGDRLGESNESFFVSLSNPTNATIADGQGVGTIADDEPRISISDVSMKEGKKGQKTLFTFTVTLSAAYDQAVTMSFRTVNGTATGGNDYSSKNGTITFAPGQTSKTITIEVIGDSNQESNEIFYLDLFSNSSNSLFIKNCGTGTILDDDSRSLRRM